MSNLLKLIKDKIDGHQMKIVFPEGTDERIIRAAARLSEEKLLTPILIGKIQTIEEKAKNLGVSVEGAEIYDPHQYIMMEELVAAFVERRKGKVTVEEARELLLDENYFGTMLVHVNKADGLVSGATHSTADTVRPALQIIKTKEGVKKTSGVFFMVREEEIYVFGDCAINISPSSEDLAEIAIESAKTAKMLNVEPRVAMLSFATKGSAVSPETEKVIRATEIVRERAPFLVVDGEIQFDAAVSPQVAAKKAPDAYIQGDANVFIFPGLESGNIGYKIAQRLGGFEAVGPILQGLSRPVNDLSRGCTEEDAYKLAIITAGQAVQGDLL